jgi:hypothetical protein|tara:strand:- start:470 stop:796 length:327 start_codon:yes stop_codon:yes gene_type:complete
MGSKSSIKLSYSWSELAPVRPLYVTTLVAQLIGAGVGLSTFGTTHFFEALWLGGALATFPGFVAGLFVQRFLRPGSLTRNRQMVLFMGFVAFFLTTFAAFFPPSVGPD